MDINVLRGLIAVLSLAVFLGIVFWAWSGRQRKRFEEAARLPFEEGDRLKAAATIAEERQAAAEQGAPTQRAAPLSPNETNKTRISAE